FLRIYRNYIGSDSVIRLTGKSLSRWIVSPPRSLLKDSSAKDDPEGGKVITQDDSDIVYEGIASFDFKSHYTHIIISEHLSPDTIGLLGLYVAEQIRRRESLPEDTHSTEREILKRSYNSISGCLWIFFKPMARKMTRKGRELLEFAQKTVDNSGYGRVIYGDTDGLMVHMSADKDIQKLESLLSDCVEEYTNNGSHISLREQYSKFAHIKGKLYFGIDASTKLLVCSSLTHKNKTFPLMFVKMNDRILSDFLKNRSLDESFQYCEELVKSVLQQQPNSSLPGLVCRITRSSPNPSEEKSFQLRALLMRMICRYEPIPDIDCLTEYMHCIDIEFPGSPSLWETPFFYSNCQRKIIIDWRYYFKHFLVTPITSALGNRSTRCIQLMNNFVTHSLDLLGYKYPERPL